jgi:adenine-specific DNA-methyltransferase
VKQYQSNERFVRYTHEQAYLLAKGSPRKPAVTLRDVLEWEYTGDELHPTQKPVAAFTPLINAFSLPGEIVLDPFIGSGTTAAAASSLGRRFIGIEIDPVYARIAKERLWGSHNDGEKSQYDDSKDDIGSIAEELALPG